MDIVVLGLFENPIFNSLNAFLLIMTGLGGLIGGFSKSFSIAIYSMFLIFSHIVIETDISLFNNLACLIIGLIILFLALRITNFGFGSNEGETIE